MNRHVARFGQNLGGSGGAHAALARAHATAGVGFKLVQAEATHRGGFPDRAGSDVLATAHQGFVGQRHRLVAVERVQERADRGFAGRRFAFSSDGSGSGSTGFGRRFGPVYPRSVARDVDVRDGRLAPCVGFGFPALLRIVPAVCATQGTCELHRRNDAVVQQQRIGGLRAVAEDDPFQFAVALGPQVPCFNPGDAGAGDFQTPKQALCDVPEAGNFPQRRPALGRVGHIQHAGWAAAGTQGLHGIQQQQRPLAGDPGALVRHQSGGFQRDLGAADRHDARQGPAWDGHRSFGRSGCQQDRARLDALRRSVLAKE